MNADEKKWEAAAGKVLEAIPSPTTQQVMRETAQQLGIPLWMLITGLLQRCYDNGEHTAPVLDPAWTFGHAFEQATIPKTVCKNCGAPFQPRWIGQEYCNAKCGSAAAQLAVAARLTASPLLRYKVGEEPEGAAKSTISEYEAHGPGIPSPPVAPLGAETEVVGGQSSGTAETIEAIEAEAAESLRA